MNVRRIARRTAVSAIALATCSIWPAAAQEPSPNVPVTQRPRPEFDPLGIRAGGFLIFPSLTVSETWDDNIFATPDDEEDDFITDIQPRVSIASNFPRHALGASLGADIGLYASESDENYEDVFADVDGRLDILRDTALSASGNVGYFHEGRDDPEDEGDDEINKFLRYGGDVSLSQAFNRMNVRLTGRVARVDFDDAEEDDRDRIDYDALLRLGFLVSPRINVFTEGRYAITDRDEDEPINRDSDGWEARIGTAVDFTAILFGEAFVGYRKEYFDNPAFDEEDGISFGADLTWNVTTLTTLSLSGGADFVPTTVDNDASANFRSAIGLRADHELLRNLLIGASVGYTRDEFDGIDRIDDTFDIGANLTYLLNRNFAIEGGYVFTDRSSDDADEEFSRNRVTVGVTARL